MDEEDEKSILLEESKISEPVIKNEAFPKSVAFIIGNEFCERYELERVLELVYIKCIFVLVFVCVC